MKKVTKAVFPVAGLGTRFLPATKANPKEMLPIIDKPLIQYAVEEAIEAGITDMIFIIGRNKRAIPDHFDMAYELETELELNGKTELLKIVQNIIPKHINCIYLRQAQALGLGHAVKMAQPVVNDEPFAVLLADDLLDAQVSVIKQMVDVYQAHQCSVLGVQNVPREQTKSYGIVATNPIDARLEQVTLGVVGRYILTPRIFHYLDQIQPGAGGEIQLTDAISALLAEEKILAYRYDGVRYDCGSKQGYLEATIRLGLRHPECGSNLKALMEKIVNEEKFS
jgi:UTP--glucose-1-phosphate uridylyltransferase